MVSLIKLAERCEKASGRNRELDALIAEACGYKRAGLNSPISGFTWRDPQGHYVGMTPGFTSSLDAAMALVPEGDRDMDLCKTRRKSRVWQARVGIDLVKDDPDETGPQGIGEGKTPALAVCAAALRARAAAP